MGLEGKTFLVTGGARRIGRQISVAVARAGGNVIIHHAHSDTEADNTASHVEMLGGQAWILKADLEDLNAAQNLIEQAWACSPVYGLINNAAIFEPYSMQETSMEEWQRHLNLNLTVPFLLSQHHAKKLGGGQGKIINLLDWRALRPGADHFAYTISKAALAAMTRSMAQALAPRITVNGLALGAILPAADGGGADVLASVPLQRWADVDEVGKAITFLLEGADYITGEILHLDGGRHLV